MICQIYTLIVQKSRVYPPLLISNYFHKESTQKGRLGRYEYYGDFSTDYFEYWLSLKKQQWDRNLVRSIYFNGIRIHHGARNQQCTFLANVQKHSSAHFWLIH
jgi:hypothetical protein